jgi:hypothetical protein
MDDNESVIESGEEEIRSREREREMERENNTNWVNVVKTCKNYHSRLSVFSSSPPARSHE